MELIAKKGKWLTQKTVAEGYKRGFWKRMTLACTLTENDIEEWTNSQKAQWEAEHPETEDLPPVDE